MALNKFMHPRNIYKIPPDFEKLSKLYQEFSNIAKMDVTGKITIDFKDPRSLRILTKCLLKNDFNLDVEIPEDRLVPTLPLRLNYILWIEDLMKAIKRDMEIRGIDIGTGACVIYPLLVAAKNKWHMVATEVDSTSLQKAKENIDRNNMQEFIQLKNNKGPKLIESLFAEENEQKFDFCMCNPPFYSSFEELAESRSPARLPPKNGFTGSPQELITEGGELKFCRKLIAESKRYKDHVLIFTTMVGHKYNFSELLQDLKADGIKHTHTEFCQGRVTRWGLAWTYQDYDIYELVPPREKLRKKTAPIAHQLPKLPNCDYSVLAAYDKIKEMLNNLHIEQKMLNKCGNRITLDILARENTWSNQRRKRRLMKRIETSDCKKFKLLTNEPTTVKTNNSTDGKKIDYDGERSSNGGDTNHQNSQVTSIKVQNSDEIINTIEETINTNLESANGKLSKSHGDISTNSETKKINSEIENKEVLLNLDANRSVNITTESHVIDTKLKKSDNEDNSVETEKSNKIMSKSKSPDEAENAKDAEPLVHAFMKLYKKEEIIHLELEFLNGTGGKESVHQIIQYIKNNWK